MNFAGNAGNVLVAQLVNGVSLGAVLALLSLGFNGIMAVGRAVHFAFPTAVVFSMYGRWAVEAAGGPPVAAAAVVVLISLAATAAVGPLFYRLRARGADINMSLVVSLALGIALAEIMGSRINQGFPVSFVSTPGLVAATGLVRITTADVAAVLVAAGVGLGLALFLQRSDAGRAVRAVAESPRKAGAIGLPVTKILVASYAVVLLGGVGAVLLSDLLGSAGARVGEQLALKVLAAAILGGLGRLWRGALAAFAVGIVDALAQGYLPGSWSNAIVFAVILLAVLVNYRTQQRRRWT